MSLQVGAITVFTKTITEADIAFFAAHSGDFHPLHMDEEYARASLFKGRIANGLQVAGLISAALARFFGICGYLSQTLYFKKPVYIGDTITAQCEIIDIKYDKRQTAIIKTVCLNQRKEKVIEGEAKVLVDTRDVSHCESDSY